MGKGKHKDVTAICEKEALWNKLRMAYHMPTGSGRQSVGQLQPYHIYMFNTKTISIEKHMDSDKSHCYLLKFQVMRWHGSGISWLH